MKNKFSVGDEIKVVFGPKHIWYQKDNPVCSAKVVKSEESWIGCRDMNDEYKYYYIPFKEDDDGFEDVKVIKQPSSFSIKEGSIESAARFIVSNNDYQPYANIEECSDSIKRCIKRMIERIKNGEEAYRCSTGGWTVLIDKEDEDTGYYVVEVLVDSSVSQDREFVNVETII